MDGAVMSTSKGRFSIGDLRTLAVKLREVSGKDAEYYVYDGRRTYVLDKRGAFHPIKGGQGQPYDWMVR